MKSLVTGVSGQDGAYLASQLLDEGGQVWGLHRRTSSPNFWWLEELGILDHPNFKLVCADLLDLSSIIEILRKVKPDEVYNLAAQSFVGTSFSQPHYTTLVNSLGPLNILEAIRLVSKDIRMYQAGTSEMYGGVSEFAVEDYERFEPKSPYGAAKLNAYWSARVYREAYGMFVANGILFNHESPLRGEEFVTRKIAKFVNEWQRGKRTPLRLGNLNAKRDWGFAPEYVEAMKRMLRASRPDDFVLATGISISVRDFLASSFNVIGLEIDFVGEGVEERGVSRRSGETVCIVTEELFRPLEVNILVGNYAKALSNLGWKPKTYAGELARIMVSAELEGQRRLK